MFVYPAIHFLGKCDCFKSKIEKQNLKKLIAFHLLHVTQETNTRRIKKIAHNESTNLVIISQRRNLHLLTYNVLFFRECRSFIAQSFVLYMTCTSAGCFYAHGMLEFTDNTHILRPPLYFLNLSLPRCSKLHKHTLQHQRPLRFLLHNFPRFQLKIDKKC